MMPCHTYKDIIVQDGSKQLFIERSLQTKILNTRHNSVRVGHVFSRERNKRKKISKTEVMENVDKR